MSSKPALLHIDFDPDLAQVSRAIAMLEADLQNKRPLMLGIQHIAQEDVEERFQTETDAGGGHWEEWSETYAPKAKDNIGILRRPEQDLYQAATSVAAFPFERGRLYFNLGVLPNYGKEHEDGSPGRFIAKTGVRNPLPQRSFSPFSPDAATRVYALAVGWMDHTITVFENRWGGTQMQNIVRTPRGPRFGRAF